MAVFKRSDLVVLGVPPAMRDRFIVRITDAKFGPSKSSGNPMVTLNMEIAGVPTTEGVMDSVKRNGATYKVAGLKCQPVYFSLTEKAISRYMDFRDKAMPDQAGADIDTDNVDTNAFTGLCMHAIVNGREDVKRKILTDEEREAGKNVGDPIIGDDGQPIKTTQIVVEEWLGKFTGELPF